MDRKKIVKNLFITVVSFFILVHLFTFFFAKRIIINRLQELTGKKVEIGYFGLTPFLHLKISNINIQDLAKIETVYISPNIFGFLSGNIAFNNLKVIHPHFTFKREGKLIQETSPVIQNNIESVAPASVAAAKITKTKVKNNSSRFIIKRMRIEGGVIEFTDAATSSVPIKITVKDINFKMRNYSLLNGSALMDFELSGNIPWQGSKEKGSISSEGWVNFTKKDMRVTVRINDIDGISLYPYYSYWVDLEKARIISAKLNFLADLQGANNNVTASCHIDLVDIKRRPLEEGQKDEKAAKLADAVLTLFKASNDGQLALDFTIHTKMDQPVFGFGDIKSAFEGKLSTAYEQKFKVQDVFMWPSKVLQEVGNGAVSISRTVIDGTIIFGKEVGKATDKVFGSEPVKK